MSPDNSSASSCSTSPRRRQRRIVSPAAAFLVIALAFWSLPSCAATGSDGPGTNRNDVKLNGPTPSDTQDHVGGSGDGFEKDSKARGATKSSRVVPISAEAMRKNWQKTFEEIKSLVVEYPASKGRANALLNRWKLLLDSQASMPSESDEESSGEKGEWGAIAKTRKRTGVGSRLQRFEGFATWEKKLQEWADEVSALTSAGEEQDHPLSSYLSPTVLTDGTPTAPKVRLPSPSCIKPGEPVVPHTDISDKSKRIWIVTTAALPWMTGTAVNPLLRAAYLTEGRSEMGGSVTLLLPWLERKEDRDRVYGVNRTFETEDEQEVFIRDWLRNTAEMERASEELNIHWYTAWQERAENSLYSMGDITALIPEEAADICVLEEPEHLNWYRAPGESWTSKFKHVVGIVHTNYFVYAQEQPAALIRAPAMRLLCSWMCRAHCHRVIKLSGTLGEFAPEKELVENVHGVRHAFLETGRDLRTTLLSSAGQTDSIFGPDAGPTVYFIGKMLWSKGLGSLMELVKYAEESAGLKIKVDMYGGGPDKDEAAAKSSNLGLDMPFHGPIDHAELSWTHKIFVNPSTSEVLCTTVAEALAMGKFVVVPSHPSNDFFAQFPNCLPYTNKEEFVGNLYYAFTHSPEPLTEEYSYALTWEAATERFEAAGSVSVAESEAMAHALSSEEAGVEIKLPPLIESETQRKKIASTFKQSRDRYRQFRSRLSQEIQQSNVLPKDLQKRMVTELEKRLDLDLDEIFESPKLRLKLSPAELDKQLLDFYNTISQSSSGDILRVIGGGTDVGKQNLYLKQQARKSRTKGMPQPINRQDKDDSSLVQLPVLFDRDDGSEEDPAVATQWIKRALRRNLPPKNLSFVPMNSRRGRSSRNAKNNQRDGPKMSLTNVCSNAKFQHVGGTKSLGMSCKQVLWTQLRPIPCSSSPPLI